MSVRRYIQYCGRWLYQTWFSAWTISDFLATLVMYIIPVVLEPYITPFVKEKLPGWEGYVADMAWALPLAALLLIGTIRFFIVPYWLDEERKQEINALKDLHQQSEASLTQWIAVLESRLNGREERRQQRDKLALYSKQGKRLLEDYLVPNDVTGVPAKRWSAGVVDYLKNNFEDSYAIQFEEDRGLPASFLPKRGERDHSNTKITSEQNQRIHRYISTRLLQLDEIMKELRGKKGN